MSVKKRIADIKKPITNICFMDRYSRQILFEGIGEEGQSRLRASRVLVVGCGALGSAQVEILARAGVGRLMIVDRDFVEESNLQRQTMFTERDARERVPKAVAAVRRVSEINSDVECAGEVADVNQSNIERLIEGCDVVLDGTDNFATRFLLNDACVKNGVAWIYGAAVGSYGVTMTVRPHISPCLRCVFPEEPAAASAPTCDTAGVIMPIIVVVAAVQVAEALKILAGRFENLHGSLMQFDVWRNEWRRIALKARAPDCPACALGRFETLEAEGSDMTTILCGRNAVQVTPRRTTSVDLDSLAARLKSAGEVKSNPYLVRLRAGGYELTIFKDARAIVSGTDDASVARTLYARYVGT
jgi:molybdopterin/thiamine biosynthesis adenylyltransferase